VGWSPATIRLLACCHGFEVEASGEPVGRIATPVFEGLSLQPTHLILRTVDAIPGRFRLVPSEFVSAIDPDAHMLRLDLAPDEVAALEER
jgi:hypothetical protein